MGFNFESLVTTRACLVDDNRERNDQHIVVKHTKVIEDAMFAKIEIYHCSSELSSNARFTMPFATWSLNQCGLHFVTSLHILMTSMSLHLTFTSVEV